MKKAQADKKSGQGGNALFLILIAVALFAALSYAITRSSRSSGTVQKETDMILAAQIVQIGSTLQVAAQRLMLTGVPIASVQVGCSVVDETCIFGAEGGGLTMPSLPPAAFVTYDPDNPPFAAVNPDSNFNVTDVGSSATAKHVALFINLTEGVCRAINKGLGITGIPVQDATVDDFPPFVTFTAAPGHPAACVDLSILDPAAGNVYYHVLLES